jgi:hypothetical protein
MRSKYLGPLQEIGLREIWNLEGADFVAKLGKTENLSQFTTRRAFHRMLGGDTDGAQARGWEGWEEWEICDSMTFGHTTSTHRRNISAVSTCRMHLPIGRPVFDVIADLPGAGCLRRTTGFVSWYECGGWTRPVTSEDSPHRMGGEVPGRTLPGTALGPSGRATLACWAIWELDEVDILSDIQSYN